ncbi:hypothetical protein [Winogradskyella bathintestinalis]|uniref:Uncharacterized protein n=1 Tax=Winogradskyella bathintestinalis TaxID=3035208 RepID=A0ABT7ZVF4_9FLAO|nr:hypothetical protein [Winogradskyella bathintestinalis]MDN3492952.1 hypothetical protein [Winogradskyella bathintestinalis]
MSASAMITSVRNNLNLLSKRRKLKNRLSSNSFGNRTEYNFPKATTKQIKAIGKRLQEERKIRMLKVILLTAILFLVILGVFAYSADGIVELISY